MKGLAAVLLLTLAAVAAAQPAPKPKVFVKFVIHSDTFRDDLGDSDAAKARPGNVDLLPSCETAVSAAMQRALHDRFPYIDWVLSPPAPYQLIATLVDDQGDQLIGYGDFEVHTFYHWYDKTRPRERDQVSGWLERAVVADIQTTASLDTFAQKIPLSKSVEVRTNKHDVVVPVIGIGAERSSLRVKFPEYGWMVLEEAADVEQIGVVSTARDFKHDLCEGVEWDCMWRTTKGRSDLIVTMEKYRQNR